jgi:DNA-binding MarR family transcriptional regulator
MIHAVGVGPGADAQRVRTLIFMVGKSVMRDLDRRLDASGAGISGPQYSVMRLLSEESATITELSSRMMVAPATLVPVVDALERKGFVQRGVDPKDRRRIPLVLTDAGAEVVTRVAVVAGPDSLVQGLSGLGREKAQQLQALLIELVNQFAEDDVVLDRAFAMNLNDPPRAG